jgi:DNA invertase Pin-like site-specific DNA recombinase
VSERSGFAQMLERLMSNGARTIIVESPDRFARDPMVQLAGHDMLKARGMTLIAASAPMHFVEDTPTAVLVRQVLGAFAEFEKTTLVAKLAAARRRKRMATGEKVEGRKSHVETRPDVVALAKRLARKKPKGGALSLRAISASLAEQGHLNERGKPFNPKSVAVMLAARAQWQTGRNRMRRAKASSRPLSSITGSCSASLTRWSPSIPNAKPHGQRSRSMRSR